MLKWFSLWWENRFPPKPLPMVGLIGLLTEKQRRDIESMKAGDGDTSGDSEGGA